MKYKETVVHYHYDLFDKVNLTQLSKELKINRSYLSQIKNGKVVATKELYIRIIEAKNRLLTSNQTDTSISI